MKAIETTATINEHGELTLDKMLGISKPQRVRVIVLISEDDPDETPTEIVIQGIHQGLREALHGQTIPLSEMWEESRLPGLLTGQLSDTFFEPLPEEELQQWE